MEIRPLTTQRDLEACVDLQEEIWGQGFTGIVPASLLKVTTYVGGILAGAFEEARLVGFVFGITGVEHGDVVHWSHMLGVTPSAQGQGIGRALKEHQRVALRQVGVARMYWTFDPLVARNAHFNFNVLGVHAKDYVVDMYGEGTSPLHRGIGTDRLVVYWPMDGTSPKRPGGRPQVTDGIVRIQIPGDIADVQASDMKKARAWRDLTRAAFLDALSQGLAVTGFELDAVSHTGTYVLTPATAAAGAPSSV